jgi:hypothetical protein
MPPNKEPDAIADPAVESVEGQTAYEQLFARGDAFRARGEASTSFTKRHLHGGVPERAIRVLGPELALVFVARNPIDRIVSHVNHTRLAGRDFDPRAAIDVGSKYVDTSRYAYQLEPWIDAFGRDRLLVIDFRELVEHPAEVLQRTFLHLGVDPALGPTELVQSNAASSARIESALLQRFVTKASWYEATAKNWVPSQLRRGLRNRLVKEVDIEPLSRSDIEITDAALALLESDRAQLAALTGVHLEPVA